MSHPNVASIIFAIVPDRAYLVETPGNRLCSLYMYVPVAYIQGPFSSKNISL